MHYFIQARILLVISFACLSLCMKRCPQSGITGKTIQCYQCNKPSQCKEPTELVKCDEDRVKWTLDEMKKQWLDSEVVVKPTDRYMCFAQASRRFDNREFAVRGCMYFLYPNTKNIITKGKFDFNKFLRYRRRTKRLTEWDGFEKYTYEAAANFEEHDREYWNKTHFFQDICFQCADKFCNEYFSPYSGKKIFQRAYLYNLKWACNLLAIIHEPEFRKTCRDRKIIGPCADSWHWYKQIYHNLHTWYSGYVGGTTASS